MKIENKIMSNFSKEDILANERKFMKFIYLSVIGIKKDYYRKKAKKEKRETFLDDLPVEKIESCMCRDKPFKNDICQSGDGTLSDAIASLKPMERQVIHSYYTLQETEIEIAKEHGVTQQYINKVKNRAKNKIEWHIIKFGDNEYSNFKKMMTVKHEAIEADAVTKKDCVTVTYDVKKTKIYRRKMKIAKNSAKTDLMRIDAVRILVQLVKDFGMPIDIC